jgi:hypothetical protein
MKLMNRYGIASFLGVQAVCIPLLFPLFSPAVARSTVAADEVSTSETGGPSALLGAVIIRSTGRIESDVERFRSLLGDPNNGVTPGEQPAGRREINWDAVPAAVTNVTNFPNAFFNTNSPRGLTYDAVSRGLEVSDNRFLDINPTYTAEFNPFSGQKIFSPLGNNEADVRFFVAGSKQQASVRGIGVVFLDVDSNGSSGLVLIGGTGNILGRIPAPTRSDARGASFVGVVFPDDVIFGVRIVTGDGVLSSDEIDVSQGGLHDLVVIDDLIYGEPEGPES